MQRNVERASSQCREATWLRGSSQILVVLMETVQVVGVPGENGNIYIPANGLKIDFVYSAEPSLFSTESRAVSADALAPCSLVQHL